MHADKGILTDDYLSMALTHLYRVATKEVLKFNSKQFIEKIAVNMDGYSLLKTGLLKVLISYLQANLKI